MARTQGDGFCRRRFVPRRRKGYHQFPRGWAVASVRHSDFRSIFQHSRALDFLPARGNSCPTSRLRRSSGSKLRRVVALRPKSFGSLATGWSE